MFTVSPVQPLGSRWHEWCRACYDHNSHGQLESALSSSILDENRLGIQRCSTCHIGSLTEPNSFAANAGYPVSLWAPNGRARLASTSCALAHRTAIPFAYLQQRDITRRRYKAAMGAGLLHSESLGIGIASLPKA